MASRVASAGNVGGSMILRRMRLPCSLLLAQSGARTHARARAHTHTHTNIHTSTELGVGKGGLLHQVLGRIQSRALSTCDSCTLHDSMCIAEQNRSCIRTTVLHHSTGPQHLLLHANICISTGHRVSRPRGTGSVGDSVGYRAYQWPWRTCNVPVSKPYMSMPLSACMSMALSLYMCACPGAQARKRQESLCAGQESMCAGQVQD